MDLPRLAAMNEYWRMNPPVHLLVKWFIGYEAKDVLPPDDQNAGLLDALMNFPQG